MLYGNGINNELFLFVLKNYCGFNFPYIFSFSIYSHELLGLFFVLFSIEHILLKKTFYKKKNRQNIQLF